MPFEPSSRSALMRPFGNKRPEIERPVGLFKNVLRIHFNVLVDNQSMNMSWLFVIPLAFSLLPYNSFLLFVVIHSFCDVMSVTCTLPSFAILISGANVQQLLPPHHQRLLAISFEHLHESLHRQPHELLLPNLHPWVSLSHCY